MSLRLVIDTSVYVAIIAQEPEADTFVRTIRSHGERFLSAAGYVECALVSGRWQAGRADLDAWLARESITITGVDHILAQHAADAFGRFGKGRHPAALNFGDCFSYALAMYLNAPLLFKGEDFSRTDVLRPSS